MLPPNSWMYGFLLECGGFTKCYTVRENQHALFQQLLRADSSSDRADTSCSPPLFMLYFICFDSVHVITNAVSSYVQLPCCVLKTLFPWSQTCLWSSLFPHVFYLGFKRLCSSVNNTKIQIYSLIYFKFSLKEGYSLKGLPNILSKYTKQTSVRVKTFAYFLM